MSEATKQYEAKDFQKLTDREHVRERFGMYVGSDGIDGIHHLADDLINNAVDEVMAGHATQITITLHRDGSVSVEDDGRGIPVDRHDEESARQGCEVSVLEVLMSRFLMGGKHDKAIKTSSGRYGLGVQIVNFLSHWCEVRVYRKGLEFHLRFEEGTVAGKLQQLGPTTRRGTRITFQADPKIFTTMDFDFVRLQARLRELSLLHPTLTTRIRDERTHVFQFERGISQMVHELGIGHWSCSEVFRLDTEGYGAQVEIAFQFTLDYVRQIRLYVNDILMPLGGTPVKGLLAGITRAVAAEAKSQGLNNTALCNEFSERVAAVIAVRILEPQFEGAYRYKLGNAELTEVVESAVNHFLNKQFAANPELIRLQWDVAEKAVLRRKEMEEYMEECETD